jgi:hypothetical protein
VGDLSFAGKVGVPLLDNGSVRLGVTHVVDAAPDDVVSGDTERESAESVMEAVMDVFGGVAVEFGGGIEGERLETKLAAAVGVDSGR